jgi:hypothetical protein
MNRYLVESDHTEEECHHVVEQFVYYGYINHFDWGCQAGVHSSWAIVEAEDEHEALLSVPAFIRPKARAIQLNKFTPEEMQHKHAQTGAGAME